MQNLIGDLHSYSMYDLRKYKNYFQNTFHLQLFVNKNTDVYLKYLKNEGQEIKFDECFP